MLKNTIGNLDGVYEKLVKLGNESGHTKGMAMEYFGEMISNASKQEFKNKTNWLQILGCYKALQDYNIVK